MPSPKPAHQRILLKLSGEALMGDDAFGINRATIVRIVEEVAEVTRLGVQLAVVIGGGNIFRGVAGGSVDRRQLICAAAAAQRMGGQYHPHIRHNVVHP